jgi:pyruvate/2-oxoglutarate/acetoin dehydrogenase E1 component
MVNHLDKMEEMSSGQFKPKVIIRTAIGSVKPLFPGPQHCQDHTEAIKMMLKNIDVVKLNSAKDVFPAYKKALESDKSTLLVEIPDLYESE